MKDRKAAVRYAKAFFADACDREAVDGAIQDLLTLSTIWEQSPDLVKFLRHPSVPAERKKQVCSELFATVLNEGNERLVALLIDRKRVELLPEIAEEFQKLVDDYRGIVRAHVRTASPLTDEELTRLNDLVGAAFGGTPVVDVQTHPELIGGMTIRVKDTYVDGSVRTSLNSIATQLRSATVDMPAASDNAGD
ncbi:MAG TPA: ATP synthase F1 subunit delta [Armatimonadota bacterium]|nr:ATP synthase F1 subunit delta [Armatimonadota bacterium]